MNIDSLSKFADKYEYLIVLAALEDELMKLDTSDDNKDFIKNISDVKYKGKIFSFLRKNPKLSVQELKNQLEKEKAEDEKKEKLKESAIPPEWLPIINHLNTPEKLKVKLPHTLYKAHIVGDTTIVFSEALFSMRDSSAQAKQEKAKLWHILKSIFKL